MVLIKVVLLTEPDVNSSDISATSKSQQQLLAKKIQNVITNLNFQYETVEFSKLQFQEQESVDKFLSANIVIMDLTNENSRPALVYCKCNREGIGCYDDIVLIQRTGLENSNAIQDLKTTCKIKNLITYRYDEKNERFMDLTNSINHGSVSFGKSLRDILKQAAESIELGITDRYINQLELRKNTNVDKETQSKFIWKDICEDFLQERNQRYATPKLIIMLMYAFRDLQDYESMIKLIERCEQFEEISKNTKNNRMISYLTAFARSRRNHGDDQDKALEILERLCLTNPSERELSNDITCLIGRIYKDKYTAMNCEDETALEKAIEWYRRGFRDEPNIYAGINLLCLLALTIDDLNKDPETYKIIIQLYGLLGKRGRQLKDLNDYWEVATYFELHTVRYDWKKACQAALHMYLLNPPIWYLKSTINNLKILHQARQIRRNKYKPSIDIPPENQIYSFWMEFFCDAIASNSPDQREFPAQVPILACEDYAKNDGSKYETIYLEAHLQLNLHSVNEPPSIIFRFLGQRDLLKSVELNSIRSIVDVKRDDRSIFFCGSEISETFSPVDLQIFFPSAERRTAFNERISHYRQPCPSPVIKEELELEFCLTPYGDLRLLGRGIEGCVYLVRDRRTRREYAVKEIPIKSAADPEKIQNQIQNSLTLHHKNIVSYYGSAIDTTRKPRVFQIFMEYVDGGSLSKVIANSGKFSEHWIQIYTRQILEGLQYLHERLTLHRDIKSGNILLNSRGRIKIADFGSLTRLAGLHLCTEPGIGTSNYMSPDVVAVSPMGYGSEVDIWGVGCTVIEMATGKQPFDSFTNEYAVQYKVAIERAIPEIPKDLSEDAQDFLAKCFAPKAERPSAKALLGHPFLRKKHELDREPSYPNGNDAPPNTKFMCVKPVTRRKDDHDDDDHNGYELTLNGNGEIPADKSNRSKLASFLVEEKNRRSVIDDWIELIEKKSKAGLLDFEKSNILLNGILNHLDNPHDSACLENALNEICDLSKMDADSRMELERSVYFFTEAVNTVSSKEPSFSPHVLFACDKMIRRIADILVEYIRTDARPAPTPTPDLSKSDSERFFPQLSAVDRTTTDDIYTMDQKYINLAEQNREKLRQLIDVECESKNILANLSVLNGNGSVNSAESSQTMSSQSVSPEHPFVFPLVPPEQPNTQPETPPSAPARGVKRTRSLLELEKERDVLLKRLIDNRRQVRQLILSRSTSNC